MSLMEEYFRIEGSAGAATLEGSIEISGAKNAIIKGMAASVLFGNTLSFSNVPWIQDIETFGDILRSIGATVTRDGDTLSISAKEIGSMIPPELMGKLRASMVLVGPLLARTGRVEFSHPGGDVIGERPIDLFLEVLEGMGAHIKKEGSQYHAHSPQGLRGTEFFFRIQSVTGTEGALLAAVLAEGTTIIKNAALEPEIAWLAEVLNACGARISGAGTTTITVEGRKNLLQAPTEPFAVVPDRIEAGSFAILSALCGKEVLIEKCEPAHLEALWDTLERTGADFAIEGARVRIRAGRKLERALLKTHEYPGFPTDLMAPMVALCTQAQGESRVFETIWDNRLLFTETLRAMGADITVMDPHRALIKGPTPLRGRKVESPDIRAGLAFLIAAAVAEGESQIRNIYHIDRGYGKIAERLQALGMRIERLSSPVALDLSPAIPD